MKRDILIIGGGVVGLSIAWRAATSGASVGVIDAGARLPPATRAAAGMLAPSFETGDDGALSAMSAFSRESLARWPGFAGALAEQTNVGIDLQLDGVLGAAFDEAGLAALVAGRQHQPTELLSAREISALEPALSDRVVGGVLARGEGEVDARLLLEALGAACAAAGVNIAPGDAATRLSRETSSFRVETAGGARHEGAAIVLASGARRLDIGAPFPPVAPVKGDALAVDGPRLSRVVRAPGAYLCPKADGRLLIGATEVRDCDDETPDHAALDALKARASRACPAVAAARDLERWSGLRPGTPDGAPILGPCREAPGLFFALGAYRNGVLLAPAIAEAMTRLIVDGVAHPRLGAFAAERFA